MKTAGIVRRIDDLGRIDKILRIMRISKAVNKLRKRVHITDKK